MNTNQDPAQPATPAASEPVEPVGPPPRASRSKWILIAAAAIAVALFAAPMVFERHPAATTAPSAAVSTSNPACSATAGPAKLDFTVKEMNGGSVKLAEYKGKVILLNFWATWCGPCKLEIPEFVELYDQYKDRGFVILGMLTDDTPAPEELRAFVNEYKMKYPILYSQDDIADAFGPIYGIPTSFFIGRDGSICLKHMGPATKEELEQTLKSLL